MIHIIPFGVLIAIAVSSCNAAPTKQAEPVADAAPMVIRELTYAELAKINKEAALAARARRMDSKAKFNRLDSFK